MSASPKTVTSVWRRRWFALAFTVGMILLSSAVFTLPFDIPLDQKAIFFLRVLFGPFGWLLQNPPGRVLLVKVLCVVPLVLAYSAYPSWITFAGTCIGIFLWWGCSVAAATGGA